MDTMQPGWRDRLVFKKYLPSLTVAHAEVTAAIGGVDGRPASRLSAFDNVWIAGDWVGPRGQLSDAAAASASDAADAIKTAIVARPFSASAHDRFSQATADAPKREEREGG